jgi:tRNA(fMet)-specific endonuclease VapC
MNGSLVDTYVISEILRPVPDANVVAWSQRTAKEGLYLSVISMGELRKGLTILPASARRSQLQESIEEQIPAWFGDRILPLTQPIAERWGVLAGRRQLVGRPLNVPDGQIAATALEHGLSIITRNVRDFEDLGIAIVNPWEST